MIYEQKTGKLTDDLGQLLGRGYSGHGEGKNNPEMESVKNIGPIPRGKYYKGVVIDSDKTGPFSIALIPDENNEMYGRSGFMLHGDSKKLPGTASTGCIAAPRKVRKQWYNSDDNIIDVI
jgi:hypothetical protein